MQKLIAWKGRANANKITLSNKGKTLTADEIGNISKIEIKYNDIYYSSSIYPGAFDMSTEADSGAILIKPGLLPIPAGNDMAELVVYDAGNQEGIVWLQFIFVMRDDAYVE